MTVNLPSTEGHQYLVMPIWKWRRRMDIWAYNCTIDLLPGQKYKILEEKHEFKYCRYRNLQNMQNVICGCQIIDFDWALLSNRKGKHIICIYRWTRWTTRWVPPQFRWVGSILSNRTQMDGSGLLTIQTANLAPVRFRPGPGPEVTVQNRC